MNVIVDMIDAEAMIADTAGAVTEFQIGIVRICPPAYSTLVVIELVPLLLLDLLRFFAEIDRLMTRLPGEISQQCTGEENREVEHFNDRPEIHREGIGDHCEQKIKSINKCEVLHLDGDEEKQQNSLIREKCRIGKEHGEVEILRINADANAADEVH